jgi:Protein of unknown function, DUF488
MNAVRPMFSADTEQHEESRGNDGPDGNCGKPKAGFPRVPTGPWKSRTHSEIPTFPPLRRTRGKVENQKQVSHFPSLRFYTFTNKQPALPLVGPKTTQSTGAPHLCGLHSYLTQPTAVWVTSLNELTGLDELMRRAARDQVAIMCAEAVPWRCHRSLVADALTARGVQVFHIMTKTQAKAHTLTRFARIEGSAVTYPAGPDTRRSTP